MPNPPEPNCSFSLELAEDVASITCSRCGKELTSVCGFITRDGDAYSTYFALLHTGHDEIVVLLTLSIGTWWDDEALNERHWVALTVRPSETQFNMRIEEPEKSRHVNWKPLGIPMNRNEALTSPLRKAFFEIADYIVEQDPAVNSYLNGREVNFSRGLCKH
jgi:hypothetical protein